MTCKDDLLFGLGTKDADHQVYITSKNGMSRKSDWICPFYKTWWHMMRRCYSEKYQEQHTSYIGCLVSRDWHKFSNFMEWMSSQDWQEKELDKDILIPGNKVYSPESCIFVSKALNAFVVYRGKMKGDFLPGAHWNKDTNKYRALCSNPFTKKREHLGLFLTEEEAHLAWKARKHDLACIYADQQTDHRIADALRRRYS